jgi:uncharacterized membrane protein YcaP (DUF421 family)
MEHIFQALIGDLSAIPTTIAKTVTLFVTAAALFRFTERRTLAEFAPFDWIAAVAAGAIVGRSATAADTSWLAASVALLSLLTTHAVLSRLRFIGWIQRLLDPPPMVLIRNGKVLERNVHRCGLTQSDLQAVLRQHGHRNAERVELAVFEAKGAVSVLSIDDHSIQRAPAIGLGPAFTSDAQTGSHDG